MTTYPSWSEHGSGYIYADEKANRIVEAHISRLRDSGGRLSAEVAILVNGAPVARSTPTLTSVSGVDQFWRKLNRRMPHDDHGIDWEAYIEALAGRAIDAHRRGEPEVALADVIIPDEIEWAVEPYFLANQANVIYGEGSSGKSLLCTWMAVLCDTGHVDTTHQITATQQRVLYLDYETDQEEILRRIQWLQNGMGITSPTGIIYRRCTHPLAAETDRIRDIVIKHNIGMIIVDSLGLATGGGLDEAEAVLEYFNALRYIGRTSVTVTHTNKEGKIFGSVYTLNSGRSVWEVKRSSPAKGIMDLVTFHRKANIIGREKPRAYQMVFGDNIVHIKTKGILETEVAPQDMSVSELVYQLVETEGPTAKEMLPELVANYKDAPVEKTRAAVTTAVSRHLRNGRLAEDGKRIVLPNTNNEREANEWTTV